MIRIRPVLVIKLFKMTQLIRAFEADKLQVRIYENEEALGRAAADNVEQLLEAAITDRGSANLILATGTSQFSFLEALQQRDINWSAVTVFHLDEYKGLSPRHPASFRRYLKERILDAVSPGQVYLINGDAEHLDEEIRAYEQLLINHPVDVACIGIGENGHIAFNDPPVADFNDPQLMKIVELDEACRMQQLGEGWFPSFDDVPREALTLTIPAIMKCKAISCVVPGERKALAVNNALNGPVDTSCPASILRTHLDAILFIDREAAADI
jgi:glucosamine-6-phosphate deaminase